MKISKARLKTLIKEEVNKELAADFVENDIVDYLIKIGAIEGPNDEEGYDSDMDRVYRDAAKFLQRFAIPYLRKMADVIERAAD